MLPLFEGYKLASVYFGGGTPTLFGIQRLEKLLSMIDRRFSLSNDIEVTIETNPEERFDYKLFKDIGINRISLGVQSLHANELKILDRRHTPQQSINTVYEVANAGISNITIDLMYELPEQTEESWNITLKQAATLPITHLSLYNLTIEPHTPFKRREGELKLTIPDEECGARMYCAAQKILTDHDFCQYEISAFCKGGRISKHNTGYWTGRPFLGLGPSAFSYYGNARFRNVANLTRYAKLLEENIRPVDFEEVLTPDERRKELLAINLRLLEGINFATFEERFGRIAKESHDALQKLASLDLLTLTPDHVALSKRGTLFYDSIATEII